MRFLKHHRQKTYVQFPLSFIKQQIQRGIEDKLIFWGACPDKLSQKKFASVDQQTSDRLKDATELQYLPVIEILGQPYEPHLRVDVKEKRKSWVTEF